LPRATLPWSIQQQSAALLSGAALLTPASLTCHQRALRIVTGCLRPTPANNRPIFAGIQPAELRRKGDTPSLARRATEPRHLLHSALTPIEWECTPSQIKTSIFTCCSTSSSTGVGGTFSSGASRGFSQRFFQGGAKSGEICFLPLEIEKIIFFCY